MTSKLFQPFQLGSISLKNRIVMAPMTRSRAIGNLANDLMAEYYAQRASAGLIITEGTSPSPNGLGYARIPGLFNQTQAESWTKVTQRVHENGGRIFLQIMHTGRIAHSLNLPEGAKVLAPSAMAAPGQMWTDQSGLLDHPTPQEMSENEIEEAIQEHANAAALAIEAGFDGIELHGANGYLLNQFLNKASNQRSDNWGGSPQNRIRFVVKVAEEVAKKIGPEKVGLRISPYGEFNSMQALGHDEEYIELAKELSRLRLVYLHVIDPGEKYSKEFQNLYPKLRAAFQGTMILVSNYDRARAENDLLEGKTDLAAFGKPFISNPDLVERMKEGKPLSKADEATFYTPDEKGYTDYPRIESKVS